MAIVIQAIASVYFGALLNGLAATSHVATAVRTTYLCIFVGKIWQIEDSILPGVLKVGGLVWAGNTNLLSLLSYYKTYVLILKVGSWYSKILVVKEISPAFYFVWWYLLSCFYWRHNLFSFAVTTFRKSEHYKKLIMPERQKT